MPLNIGEWIVCEQALSEIKVNGEGFPNCLRWQGYYFLAAIEGWDEMSLPDRIGYAAIFLKLRTSLTDGPAKIIHSAYLKLCRTA